MPIYGIDLKNLNHWELKSEKSDQFWGSQMLLISLFDAPGTYIDIYIMFTELPEIKLYEPRWSPEKDGMTFKSFKM